MNNDLNNCNEIRIQLLEVNATDTLTDSMQKHLDDCKACSSLYQDIHAINQGLESMPEHDVSDEVFNQTLQAIQVSQTANKNTNKGINPQWATGLAASFVLVAVTGLIYNGSISEFQTDFNQIPAASESEFKPKPKLDKRANRQQPAEKAEAKQEGSDTSVDVVYFEDLDMDSELHARKIPAKPAPAVKNNLNEMIAQGPAARNAPLIEADSLVNEPFDDAKVAADRMMQDDENNAVTGSRIKKAETKNSGPMMSLDQLLNVAQRAATESPIDPEREKVFEAQRLKVTREKAVKKPDELRQESKNLINEYVGGKGPMRPLDQLGVNVVSRAATNNSDTNLKREAQFKNQVNKLSKDKAKRAELSAEVNSSGNLAAAKEGELKPVSSAAEQPRPQPRRDAINDGLLTSVEESEALESGDLIGGGFGRSSADLGSIVADDTAIKYLAELQVTENLNFKAATGYWANIYLVIPICVGFKPSWNRQDYNKTMEWPMA